MILMTVKSNVIFVPSEPIDSNLNAKVDKSKAVWITGSSFKSHRSHKNFFSIINDLR